MTVKEYFSKNPVKNDEGIFQYSAVNIRFLNQCDEEDETQLNVSHSLKTQKGVDELAELFESLCGEFDTTSDQVIDISVEASAKTEAALIAMGY